MATPAATGPIAEAQTTTPFDPPEATFASTPPAIPTIPNGFPGSISTLPDFGGTVGVPTPTTSPQQQQGPTGITSTLYLYTFLATLVILLGVSGAIVVRSLTMRLQHRRAIEEAIRNGTYIPPMPGQGNAKRGALAEKPVLHDVYLGMRTRTRKDVGAWADTKPFSTTFLPNPYLKQPSSASMLSALRDSGVSETSGSADPMPLSGITPVPATLPGPGNGPIATGVRTRQSRAQATSPIRPRTRFGRFRRYLVGVIRDGDNPLDWLFQPRVQVPTHPLGDRAGRAAAGRSPPIIVSPDAHAVRVAVLVAMPSPNSCGSLESDLGSVLSFTGSGKGKLKEDRVANEMSEGEVPFLEMGVAELVVRSHTPQQTQSQAQFQAIAL